MNPEALRRLLDEVSRGSLSPAAALEQLAWSPSTDLGFARVDHHRELRCGFPEVVFCQGKRAEDVAAIGATLAERSGRVLFTRAAPDAYEAVRARVPDARYHPVARAITIERDGDAAREGVGLVAVISAGTSDIPVADEARITARMLGARVESRHDVGVAGIHRILREQELLREARVLVVVAGMEGALASVVGGLVARPVIAVPTSVGYGASFGGLAALLGMLNSCAPNVTVVNIDNGFGAGYVSALINQPLAGNAP